ncbi:NAD(P)-dependent oxidoreductase [Algoriphagus sp.]|uniref:NAD-dependent epimerase/dehydratase family protein n=1 Tax=Algoriphagus sp. TaxID=1872435 RepID=UPI0025CF2754|nr:NAD-dependent epimerase/dehydratase family protein [Algoriphagus sp.]
MIILLTGASGFLGHEIFDTLKSEHEVITLGRSDSNNIKSDLSHEIPNLPKSDIIIHAAGKAHTIPKTPEEEKDFFQVNEEGTKNLLKGVKELPKLFVLISTVAVYGVEQGENISESYALKGVTPYALSKIKAEKVVQEWGENMGVNVLIFRLPLIAGPNPPGNLGAMIKAINGGYYFRLGNGLVRKSMVLGRDIAKVIPGLLGKSGIYNLTDGIHPSLKELDQYLASLKSKKVKNLPIRPLEIAAKIGDLVPMFPLNSYRVNKLKYSLTFSDEKARKELNWNPSPVIGNF